MKDLTALAIYTGLRALLGEFPLLEDTDVVPVKVATETKPIIAAYLLAVYYEYGPRRRWSAKQELSDRMGVTEGTFQEYVARARRQAEEYKVSGTSRPYWA